MIKNTYLFSGLIDLAQPRLGTKVVYKTNDFFGDANRILDPAKPVWKESVYDDNGKWMDGWETKRKRDNGNDYLILSLGKAGTISKIDVDTSFFNGNQPNSISIEGCYSEKNIFIENIKWKTLVKKSKVRPNFNNFFNVKDNSEFTHIKLNIFPDGGIARLRLYGKISVKKKYFSRNETMELSSILNGGSVIAFNNEHFGKAENILAPGKSLNMGDGWETRRRRTKGFDWLIFKFGLPGIVSYINIDTSYFKGNYPDYFSLQASYISEHKPLPKNRIIYQSNKWKYLIKNEKLNPNREHFFNNNLLIKNKINYVRMNIFPDGGIARIKIFGKLS